MSYGLFEHLAYTDESQRVSSRKALALARVRADKSFGRFVAAAKTVDEREARLTLVAGDLEQLVKQACADCGCESYENVLNTVKEHLGFVVEARRPKMCPYHREVMDISLAAGDPKAGFSSMAQHAWGRNHCQGEWEGGCNFRPEMVTQKYWDDKAAQADERRRQREEQRQQEVMQQPQVEEAPVDDLAEHDDFEFAPEPSAVGVGSEEAVAEPQMAMAASFREAVTVPNPNIHGGMLNGLMFLEKKAPGLLLDGVPVQQFLQQNGNDYNGRPVEVTHQSPVIEDLAAQCISTGSAQPIKDYVQQQKAQQAGGAPGGPAPVNPMQAPGPMSSTKTGYEFRWGPGFNDRPNPQTGEEPGEQRMTVPCPRCGGNVPMHAPACPHCGLPETEAGTYQSRTAEALKTIDVEQGEGPSPKMDKRKWTPENVRFLDDVDSDDGPHPTRHQDIAQPKDYGDGELWGDDGRFDQTDAVLEKQDVEKSSNPTDGGGPATSTWPNKGQAKPVTSGVLPEDYEEARQTMSDIKKQHGPSSQGGDITKYKQALEEFNSRFPNGPSKNAAVDPDKNPIAESLLAEEEAQRAIDEFNA